MPGNSLLHRISSVLASHESGRTGGGGRDVPNASGIPTMPSENGYAARDEDRTIEVTQTIAGQAALAHSASMGDPDATMPPGELPGLPPLEPLPKPRVLVIDDSRIVRSSITKHIRENFDIREATNGEEGWQILVVDSTIQVVISDLGMPKLDGYGLLERIRASKVARIKGVPVIIVSGSDEERTKASALGATDFITKGMTTVELISRLDSLVRLAQTARELEETRSQVAEAATSDALTGLGTLAFIVKHGAIMFSHARRHHAPVSVLRIKLESFAAIRERTGQQVSDQILVAIARLLTGRMRKEDSAARIGDEEFVIVAPSTAVSNAVVFAKRLLEEINAAKITYQKQPIKLTASIGISVSELDRAESFADLLTVALRRLNSAITDGGSRVLAEDQVSGAPLQASAPLDIERALAMLLAGREADVEPHVGHLARRLLPLVRFCDGVFSRNAQAIPTVVEPDHTQIPELPTLTVDPFDKTQPMSALREAQAKRGEE